MLGNEDGVHCSVPGGEVDKGLEDSKPREEDILSEPDKFYRRLTEFFDSTGLNLILNARETNLDLFLFYKEVASRGGFHQINLEGKWNELVGALSLETEAKTNEKRATQLQRLYANLLFQFEQSNMPRTPAKSSGLPGLHISNIKGSSMKRKLQEGENCLKAEKLQKYMMSSNGIITKEQKSKSKNGSKKDPMAQLGHRSPYQIFLKMECDRLKKLNGDTHESQNTKKLVLDAWRHLSDVDKQPYIEASRTDRERCSREMKAYQEHLKRKPQETGIPPSNTAADVYNVSLSQESTSYDTEAPLSSEHAIELATEMLKTTPVDILLNINWDDLCGSVHVSEIE